MDVSLRLQVLCGDFFSLARIYLLNISVSLSSELNKFFVHLPESVNEIVFQKNIVITKCLFQEILE